VTSPSSLVPWAPAFALGYVPQFVLPLYGRYFEATKIQDARRTVQSATVRAAHNIGEDPFLIVSRTLVCYISYTALLHIEMPRDTDNHDLNTTPPLACHSQ
jgi:hypothetical protein